MQASLGHYRRRRKKRRCTRCSTSACTSVASAAAGFAYLHHELPRRSVTRLLLWEEYKRAHPDGWQYSVFCEQYRRWLSTEELVLRQEHAPGDKLFVEYACQTVPIKDRHTGASCAAQIFVAVLGFSNYTHAEPTLSQGAGDWLGAHVRALEYFGSAPRTIVPDNPHSGVAKAHRYDPDINRAYQDFAETRRCAICPRFSMTAMTGTQLSSPVSCRSISGTPIWVTGPSPMRSRIGSCTTATD